MSAQQRQRNYAIYGATRYLDARLRIQPVVAGGQHGEGLQADEQGPEGGEAQAQVAARYGENILLGSTEMV